MGGVLQVVASLTAGRWWWWWAVFFCAILFVCMFGIGEEAVGEGAEACPG